MPYLEPDDVLNLLFPVKKKRKTQQAELLFGDTEMETMILRLLANGIQNGEQMVEEMDVAIAEFNQALTMLEIKGRIRALGANKWTIA